MCSSVSIESDAAAYLLKRDVVQPRGWMVGDPGDRNSVCIYFLINIPSTTTWLAVYVSKIRYFPSFISPMPPICKR